MLELPQQKSQFCGAKRRIACLEVALFPINYAIVSSCLSLHSADRLVADSDKKVLVYVEQQTHNVERIERPWTDQHMRTGWTGNYEQIKHLEQL